MKGMVKHSECLIKAVVEFIRQHICREGLDFEIWEVKEIKCHQAILTNSWVA